jgi:DNA-binding response OmpR family regulator
MSTITRATVETGRIDVWSTLKPGQPASIEISRTHSRLLAALAHRQPNVLPWKLVWKAMYDRPWPGHPGLIYSPLSRLRRYLHQHSPELAASIETVRAAGIRLRRGITWEVGASIQPR